MHAVQNINWEAKGNVSIMEKNAQDKSTSRCNCNKSRLLKTFFSRIQLQLFHEECELFLIKEYHKSVELETRVYIAKNTNIHHILNYINTRVCRSS